MEKQASIGPKINNAVDESLLNLGIILIGALLLGGITFMVGWSSAGVHKAAMPLAFAVFVTIFAIGLFVRVAVVVILDFLNKH